MIENKSVVGWGRTRKEFFGVREHPRRWGRGGEDVEGGRPAPL